MMTPTFDVFALACRRRDSRPGGWFLLRCLLGGWCVDGAIHSEIVRREGTIYCETVPAADPQFRSPLKRRALQTWNLPGLPARPAIREAGRRHSSRCG